MLHAFAVQALRQHRVLSATPEARAGEVLSDLVHAPALIMHHAHRTPWDAGHGASHGAPNGAAPSAGWHGHDEAWPFPWCSCATWPASRPRSGTPSSPTHGPRCPEQGASSWHARARPVLGLHLGHSVSLLALSIMQPWSSQDSTSFVWLLNI